MKWLVGLLSLYMYWLCSLQHFEPLYVNADPFCGNVSTDACNQSCYEGCIDRLGKENVTEADVKESIATQTNLCVSKCFGNEFIPLKSADLPKLPAYSDALDCLGRCSYPVNEYCLTGYLSNFLYCDCHHCCLQKTDNKKCIHGCHLWFLRQWSPKPKQGCRYRDEYSNSPKTWCTDFCIFRLLNRDATLTWNDIPTINQTTAAATCIRRCISLVLSGVPLDFDADVVPCSDLSKCISVSVFEFRVFSTYDIDEMVIRSHIKSQVNMSSIPFYIIWEGTNVDEPTTSEYDNITHEFEVHRVPALDNMHSLGVRISTEPGAEGRIQLPSGINYKFPWYSSRVALAKAYNYNTNSRVFAGDFTYFERKVELKLQPCTQFMQWVWVTIAEGIRFEHEVTVKISDTQGLFPLTAGELRNAISQKREWNGLEYVRDFDAHTIVMKGRGYALASFGVEIHHQDFCSEVSGCDHPKNRSVRSLCGEKGSTSINRGQISG